jgi:hypothetical protein
MYGDRTEGERVDEFGDVAGTWGHGICQLVRVLTDVLGDANWDP